MILFYFVFSYLPKLKWGLGLAFGAHFLHDVSIKIFLIQYSIYGQNFNVVPSQDIKQNVLSSYLDNWWRHKLQDLSSVIL